MPPLSNAEKQARHRKKEALKKIAHRCFVDASLGAWQHANASERLEEIKKLAELPSSWTDEDFDWAVERMEQLRMDLIMPDNDLQNDVHQAGYSGEEFLKTSDPKKFLKKAEKAVEDARLLASHLISAMELTDLSNSERAAALMQAMRYVARSLANERSIQATDANIVCLTVLPPQYRRPEWYPKEFAKWIAYRLGQEDEKNQLGREIVDFDFGI
ncbi:hypothetical protein [Ruegeria sp. AU67]|uniref:hypothetical protein n=1 Tax=Ruegeria sp. AU67 TaxID=2108530 RepID=UPI000D69447E|nr:hypothetical protein [Ruegeria sp. AU67]